MVSWQELSHLGLPVVDAGLFCLGGFHVLSDNREHMVHVTLHVLYIVNCCLLW